MLSVGDKSKCLPNAHIYANFLKQHGAKLGTDDQTKLLRESRDSHQARDSTSGGLNVAVTELTRACKALTKDGGAPFVKT